MINFIKNFFLKKNHLQFAGPYENWEEAEENSTGYSSRAVLLKVEKAIIKVLDKHSAYERDGTNFESLPEKNTLLEILKKIDSKKNNAILDVGGGLGSLFINYREFFVKNNFNYFVLEQDNFILKGTEISNNYKLPINFYSNLNDIKNIDIAILSSTLQYFEDWEQFVLNLLNKKPRHIIIDRHPLSDEESKIYVQLNKNYYSEEVTYPLHICNKSEFIRAFTGYQLIKSWDSDFDPSYFKGFHFLREGNKF